jgi:hypothetical protein
MPIRSLLRIENLLVLRRPGAFLTVLIRNKRLSEALNPYGFVWAIEAVARRARSVSQSVRSALDALAGYFSIAGLEQFFSLLV